MQILESEDKFSMFNQIKNEIGETCETAYGTWNMYNT